VIPDVVFRIIALAAACVLFVIALTGWRRR
jgi:hypothetical protein